MNLSDQLLALFEDLQAKGMAEDLFRDDEVQGLLLTHAEFHELREQLAELAGGREDVFLLLALRAMAKQKAALLPAMVKTDLVVTFPGAARIPARHTAQVVREMIGAAKQEIIVAGYAITGKGELPKLLAGAAGTVSRITVLCDVWKDSAGTSASKAILNGWPKGGVRPRIYEFNADGDAHLMHVKTLIVDGRELLVTSANFTGAGMNKNVEFGVRIIGQAASDAKAIFDQFIKSGRFSERTEPSLK